MSNDNEILNELICLRRQINKVIEKIQKPPGVREQTAPQLSQKEKRVNKYLEQL